MILLQLMQVFSGKNLALLIKSAGVSTLQSEHKPLHTHQVISFLMIS
jgi:hypothetical protein